MRAARLVDLLLILQRRGRVTAAQLALELEVSTRTILRDVEALGQAGVPIVGLQGVGGGIELLGGFRTQLTGLTPAEARCLFLVGQPRVARLLGLEATVRGVREKLLEGLTLELQAEPETLDSWFILDPRPWTSEPALVVELPRLASAIERRLRVELRWTDRHDIVTTEPLGLVAKSGDWYLVHLDPAARPDAVPAVVPLARLASTRITRNRFEHPPGFHLGDFWDRYLADRR
jgi:predicted DNA-binding transcriptional regulator YafY